MHPALSCSADQRTNVNTCCLDALACLLVVAAAGSGTIMADFHSSAGHSGKNK